MQYTIRNVPKDVDKEVRRRARQASKSVNEFAIEALRQAVGLGGGPPTKMRDLSDLVGKHHFDSGFDEAMADFGKIDPEQWK